MTPEGHHTNPDPMVPPPPGFQPSESAASKPADVYQGTKLPKAETEPADADTKMWSALGVKDIRAALGPSLSLDTLTRKHLEFSPYRTPHIAQSSMVWYEGSFDPIGIHHFKIFHDTLKLGFKHAVFAMVYQNPYKKDSLAYEHRYEMARRVMEKAGLKVVDDPSEEGVCLFPPGKDGLNRFHIGRLAAIYGSNNYILIGPDNFEKAMTHNIIWTHIPEIRSSPHAQELFGFHSMYHKISGFRDRVLVYPTLNSVHSTDIRNGASPMLGPVADYVKENGLYKATPSSTQAHTAKATAPTPTQPIHDSSHLAEELSLSRNLLQRLQNGLTGLPLSLQALRDNFQPVLGSSDRSQLQDLANILTKCEDRVITKPRAESCYFLDKRRDISTQLLNELSDRLIGPHIQTTGDEHISSLLKDHQAKIIFVCNESGWGEIPVLTHALRRIRFGGLADSATFVLNRPNVFSTPTIAATVGHGVTTIQPVSTSATRSKECQMQVYAKTVKAGLERLSDGPVVVFPEQSAPSLDAFKLSTIPALFLETLRTYMTKVQDPDIAASKVFIIPVGIVGSECIDGASPFSSEDPAVVSFGTPITAEALIKKSEHLGANGDEVVAHTLGFRLAELMPEEWRGCYGNSVDTLRVGDAKGLEVNTESFLLARKLFERQAIKTNDRENTN